MSIIRTTILLCYLLFLLTPLQARPSFYPELALAQKTSQNLRRNPDSNPNNLLNTAAQAVKSKRSSLEKYGLFLKSASKSKQKIEKDEVMKYGLPKGFAQNQVKSEAESQPGFGATLLYILVMIMVGLIALGCIAAIIAGVVFLVNCLKRRANVVDSQNGKRKVSDDLLLLDHARQNVSTVAEHHSPGRN